MSSRIEDYAVIGNCETMALVGANGSIDWLCLPRFDSASCLSALLGEPKHGRWLIAPIEAHAHASRQYRGNTLILETRFDTSTGSVVVIDLIARRQGVSDVVRLVRGMRGTVKMRTELVARFSYGAVVPWVSKLDDGRLRLTAGPERLVLDCPVALRGEDMRTVGEFDVKAGEEVGFVLSWSASYEALPERINPANVLVEVEGFWNDWSSSFNGEGDWSEAVLRSLITLKSLSHWQTGGIVAAGTTSLPEQLGGERNWDYRFCWLRDSTFTLYALVQAGFQSEAAAWGQWLLRAVAGTPADLQIMYGVGGERRLEEYEVSWLPGYDDSLPVRVGNAAAGQLQLDVYGEVLGAFYVARRAKILAEDASWPLECALLEHLETIWEQPDDGIWEMRGPRRHFTHSKVMAWTAFDRAVRSAEEFGLEGPVTRWKVIRDTIHAQVCEKGFDVARNTFTQSYGDAPVDASLLMLAMVGFLPASDARIAGTVAAIERSLLHEGLVLRYDTAQVQDGLKPGEGAFLACSFWLADNYVLLGRVDEARALFERLLALCNDVGLLAEQYDPVARRQLGNFPQAFSHLALINTARNINAAGEISDPASSGLPAAAVNVVQPVTAQTIVSVI